MMVIAIHDESTTVGAIRSTYLPPALKSKASGIFRQTFSDTPSSRP
jgi:hypothetical protein